MSDRLGGGSAGPARSRVAGYLIEIGFGRLRLRIYLGLGVGAQDCYCVEPDLGQADFLACLGGFLLIHGWIIVILTNRNELSFVS